MGRIQTPNGNFNGMCMFHFHGHFHRDENKPQGLEAVETANGTHVFHSDIPVGNFKLPLKTVRLFRKFSGQSNQNSLSVKGAKFWVYRDQNANPKFDIFTFQPKFPDFLVNGKHSVFHGLMKITLLK